MTMSLKKLPYLYIYMSGRCQQFVGRAEANSLAYPSNACENVENREVGGQGTACNYFYFKPLNRDFDTNYQCRNTQNLEGEAICGETGHWGFKKKCPDLTGGIKKSVNKRGKKRTDKSRKTKRIRKSRGRKSRGRKSRRKRYSRRR
jgi:hypothetical protein